MSTADYTIELEALKATLQQLDQEELDLSNAMKTYQQGVKHHERCVNILTKLEQSINKSVHNADVENDTIELSLSDVFSSLENIEQSIEELPESNLESCIDLLVQAERILFAGFRQIDLVSETMANATDNVHSPVSSTSKEEAHRV